ncbi:MAG: hypothetical protein KF819_06665 [Labilithrix sp.]|nr:hypothetical protein [Labilithrix sp.]
MKHAFRGISAVVLCLLLVSCGLLKKKGDDADAEADAEVTAEIDAAPPPAEGPVAANEADIARFPDETKLDNVAATIKRFTNVREQPLAGKVVSTLNPGVTVTEIAQRPGNFLIVFDSPKEPGKKLMGWVTADAFTAVVDAGKTITCTAPDVVLVSDNVLFCGRTCGTDGVCPPGLACKGSATVVTNGKPSNVATTVCVASAVATPTDAGTTNVALRVDAGATPATPATTTTPAPAPFVCPSDVCPPPPGGCPADFVLGNGQCHRRCKGAGKGNCPAAPFCSKCSGIGACSRTKDGCS